MSLDYAFFTFVAAVRGARGTPPGDWVEIRDIPRARGSLWHVRDAAAIASVHRYLAMTLQPDETFFNFSDTAILHYVMRRDWPIREYEMAYLQSEEKQREVIRILRSNGNVRAVLIRGGAFSIDFIPNAKRAPLLHQSWSRISNRISRKATSRSGAASDGASRG